MRSFEHRFAWDRNILLHADTISDVGHGERINQ